MTRFPVTYKTFRITGKNSKLWFWLFRTWTTSFSKQTKAHFGVRLTLSMESFLTQATVSV